MALIVVTGAAFSGKGRFVADEIGRREAEGEVGLVAIDYTPMYSSLVPGEQSQFRDEAVSETGVARWVGYLLTIAVAQAIGRELSGYILTPSPSRAIEIADEADAQIIAIEEPIETIATRINVHIKDLQRRVPRATRDRTTGRCRKAAATYLQNEHRLVGRALVATRQGNRYRVGERKAEFNQQAFLRGLHPARARSSRRTHRGRTRRPDSGRHLERAGERRIGAPMTTVEKFEIPIEDSRGHL